MEDPILMLRLRHIQSTCYDTWYKLIARQYALLLRLNPVIEVIRVIIHYKKYV